MIEEDPTNGGRCRIIPCMDCDLYLDCDSEDKVEEGDVLHIKEFEITPSMTSKETIEKAKEGFTHVIDGCTVDNIYLAGISLIFVDIKSGVCMEQKLYSDGFDPGEYND